MRPQPATVQPAPQPKPQPKKSVVKPAPKESKAQPKAPLRTPRWHRECDEFGWSPDVVEDAI
jgi:hypothetical protein